MCLDVPDIQATKRTRRRGFTLLELTIALVIIAIVTAMGMSVVPETLQSVRRAETEKKLTAIETALKQFINVYGRLPCPADITLPETDANFGVEAANAGSCTGGTPAANFGPVKKVVEGAVPITTLGLPKSALYDGWGRRIAYAVWAKMTENRAFLTYPLSDRACGAITVKNVSGLAFTNRALYVVFSTGGDGHGGYTKAGQRLSSGITNTATLDNCNCDSSGAATTWDRSYTQQALSEVSATDRFDDHVRVKYRWQLQDWEQAQISIWGGMCQEAIRLEGRQNRSSFGVPAILDINGDGINDLFIAGKYEDRYGTDSGSVYVILGRRYGWPDSGKVLDGPDELIDGSKGFRLDGDFGWAAPGRMMPTGDVNGDGIEDVLIGSGTSNRPAYIIWGGRTGSWASTNRLNTTFLNGGGTTLNGVELQRDGGIGEENISFAVGDINGDGYADIIKGDNGVSPGGRSGAGQVKVIWGKSSGWTTPLIPDATYLAGGGTAVNGTILEGDMDGDGLGSYVGAGDVNGDGIDDVIIAAGGTDFSGANMGSVYVVWGRETGWSNAQRLDSTFLAGSGTAQNGIRLDGENWYSNNPTHSVTAADINRDGYDDIMFGRYWSNKLGIVWGRNPGTWPATTMTMTSAFISAGNGVMLTGETGGSDVGSSQSVADINGDGINDIVIGSPAYNSAQGSVYVVWGRESGWPTAITLNSTYLEGGGTAVNGIRLNGLGTPYYFGDVWWYSHPSAIATGDINNDGNVDIVVGGATDTAGSIDSSYVIFGKSGAKWSERTTWLMNNLLD
ncbi:prepilin-type N-terminal cleavage/methylation domain-containing protein [Tautonia marina]|uniref:prepilin-type N-terminal cleavage/methylation domain-containing protein n=1 Tax=Tautonia marina TaxID=2653855 RepID=UPI001260C0F0|nr:prepilin-type N-terminal cleavage/methylation domain-containing protein [Tautonia marina]